MPNDDTFVRITNKDIYQEIVTLKKENQEQHKELTSHVQKTNGKVKLNKWLSTTALSTTLAIILYIIQGAI